MKCHMRNKASQTDVASSSHGLFEDTVPAQLEQVPPMINLAPNPHTHHKDNSKKALIIMVK